MTDENTDDFDMKNPADDASAEPMVAAADDDEAAPMQASARDDDDGDEDDGEDARWSDFDGDDTEASAAADDDDGSDDDDGDDEDDGDDVDDFEASADDDDDGGFEADDDGGDDDADIEASADDDDDGEALAQPDEPPEIPLDQIDADALWVVRRLRAKGHEAYLTGGCVRDLLLGQEPKDFDVATAAHPDEVKKVFRNCRLIGRRFRLAHITFPGGKVIETATFRANPNDDADEEDLEGDLLVERDNVFGTVEEDARRRDLTINGLFYDPIEGKVLDYVDGRTDLDARLIRTIGDPEIRFQEDPVRILRAIKFATRLGFEFEENTAAAMRHHVEELVRCAPARLQDEIQKLLLSGYAKPAFALMEKFGVTEALMPELVAALGDGTLEARELGEEEQEALRDTIRRERRRAARKAAAEAAAAAKAAEAEAQAAAGDAEPAPAEAAEGEADADAAAPAAEAPADEAAEPSPPADDAGEGEPAPAVEGAPEETAAPAEDPQGSDDGSDDAEVSAEVEEPIEVPTHGPAPTTPPERRQRLESLLAALDQAKAREVQIASSVALSVLLLPVWEAMRAAAVDEDAWLESLGATWTERLRMTRRDRETVQRLMLAVEDLRPSRRYGNNARNLVQRPWFREALLLYTLVLVAEGGDLSEIGAWKAIARHYDRPYKQPRIGEREPKPRRSRRRSAPRGRRRRGGGGR